VKRPRRRPAEVLSSRLHNDTAQLAVEIRRRIRPLLGM
jgi:hypothetical protein